MGRRLTALALAAAVLAGCGGGDDDERTTADPTPSESTAPAVREATTEQVCELLAPDFLRTVDRLPDEGVAGEEPRTQEVVLEDLRRLVAIAPPELQADVTGLLAALEGGTADPVALGDAYRRVAAWGATSCPLDGPVWACADPVASTTAGAEPELADAPEDLLPEHPGVRVEVERTADRVLYAWVADDGVADRTQAVGRDPEGWFTAYEATCIGA